MESNNLYFIYNLKNVQFCNFYVLIFMYFFFQGELLQICIIIII